MLCEKSTQDFGKESQLQAKGYKHMSIEYVLGLLSGLRIVTLLWIWILVLIKNSCRISTRGFPYRKMVEMVNGLSDCIKQNIPNATLLSTLAVGNIE